MRIVHLYPFTPLGRHGGTLRLAAAVAASARLGEPRIHWFDRDAATWRGPEDHAALERRLEALPDGLVAAPPSLKRRLFPSTLWESGIRARRALAAHRDRLELEPDSLAVVHTTYLAGAARALAIGPDRVAIDVYDLVWRAHENDARAASGPLAAVRRAYAAGVRSRESRQLAGAGALLVAGHEDHGLLAARNASVHWVPTATPVDAVAEPRPRGEGLRVGLLGNFAHASTRASADRLLGAALAKDPTVTIVLAGLDSREWAAAATRSHPRAGWTPLELLGAVHRVEDFYASVDCVVAPVEGGSGLKCKLGEALLAGRPVVTTELGAAGYPPELRRHLAVCDPARLDRAAVERAIAGHQRDRARDAAERLLGWEAVTARYEEALRALG